MILPAVRDIVLAPKCDSSLQDRVAVVLRCSSGIQEEDVPADVRQDWRALTAVWQRTAPQGHSWMKPHRARASALKPTEAKQVLQSFVRIADAVIKLQGRNERARVGH